MDAPYLDEMDRKFLLEKFNYKGISETRKNMNCYQSYKVFRRSPFVPHWFLHFKRTAMRKFIPFVNDQPKPWPCSIAGFCLIYRMIPWELPMMLYRLIPSEPHKRSFCAPVSIYRVRFLIWKDPLILNLKKVFHGLDFGLKRSFF